MGPGVVARRLAVLLLACGLLGAPAPALTEEVKIAVAANFTTAAKEIAKSFAEATGHQAVMSFGATGKLYAQIVNGAPFELFLAADVRQPERLEKEGKAVSGTRFTYAVGKLVLWGAKPGNADIGPNVLAKGDFGRLAIANPKTAPYGAAALEVLRRLQLYDALRPKLIYGNSIAQTYQFVATSNAEYGLIALAQIALKPRGSRWLVPGELYSPIRQQAVLLKLGAESPVAKAYLAFLKGPRAVAIIARYGYGVE